MLIKMFYFNQLHNAVKHYGASGLIGVKPHKAVVPKKRLNKAVFGCRVPPKKVVFGGYAASKNGFNSLMFTYIFMLTHSKINAYIDAEWGSDNHTICLQVLLTYGKSGCSKYLVFHEKYRELLKSKGFTEGMISGMNVRLVFNEFLPEHDVLTQLIHDHIERINLPIQKGQLVCNLYLFFSPKDLWIAIGFKNFNELIFTPRKFGGFQIEQKRSLRGAFSMRLDNGFSVSYVIKDVSGWTNRGLIVLAQSLGISSDEKSLLDDYKSKMEVGLIECTDAFIKYLINDVVLLEKIVKGMVKMVNWLCQDILKIQTKLNQTTIPMSQGSLVSRVFILFEAKIVDFSVLQNGSAKKRQKKI